MSKPRSDANCLICSYKKSCAMSTGQRYDINGTPPVDCYGFCREMTQEDYDNSTWGNFRNGMIV